MTTISVTRVEHAINRCKNAQPPKDYVLGPDLRTLATIYGTMNWEQRGRPDPSIELEQLTANERAALERWLVPESSGPVVDTCAIGRDGGECEACQ
jgi:hypothetical protein